MTNNFRVTPAICALVSLTATAAHAGSATWSGQLNSNWNVSQNWSPQTVPNGPNDVATLGGSNNRDVYLSANTEVYGITFPKPLFPTAVNYLVTVSQSLTLTISGTGITNNSGQAQNFLTAVDCSGQEGAISFTNSATAGICTITNNASTVYGAKGGFTEFLPNSTAGSASIVNAGSPANNGGSGTTYFYGGSTAGTGKFVNNPCGVAQSTGQINSGGSTNFYDRSSADNATFTNVGGALSGTGGGVVQFGGFATAGNAIAVSNGGTASGAIGGSIGFFNYATAANGNFISNGGTVSGAN